jgi:hypothetical protein
MTLRPVTLGALLACGITADATVAIVQTGAGSTPVVTVSVVTALALVDGPYRGMLIGFAAGVVLDLLAGPAVGGVHALGGVAVGALAGAVGGRAPDRPRGMALTGVVVVPAVALGVLTLHGLLGRPAVSFGGALPWAVVCGAVVTPLTAWVSGRLAIRPL